MGGARGEELVACRGVGSAGPFRGCMQGAQPCPGGCGPIGQVWPYPGGPGLTGQRRPLSGSSALRGPVLLYTLASTWAGRGRGSSSFSGSGPGGWGGPGVLHPDSLGLGPGRGAWFCDLDIPTFLKLSEEAASGLQCMERSGRGLAGNELPCCRDGNGITAAGGISVRGGPSVPTLSQVRVGVPGTLVRLPVRDACPPVLLLRVPCCAQPSPESSAEGLHRPGSALGMGRKPSLRAPFRFTSQSPAVQML